ncbi:MAG: hypothetical protein VKN33_03195 [Candidatus Sericytochromatia bacterium]|nr:hypothetical protein [Candidatus Sericytochromatia bacterium]
MTAHSEKNRINRSPEFLFRPEADTLYGVAVEDPASRMIMERELAELSDKMILEITTLFDDHPMELDFSEESLTELDGLIETLWPEPIEDPDALDAIVANWGAYLGETVIQNLGGHWTFRQDLDHVSICFPRTGLEAFPLHLMRKRLMMGAQESIAGFYEALVAQLVND